MCNGKMVATQTPLPTANRADADADASLHLRRFANWNLQYGIKFINKFMHFVNLLIVL